VRTFETTYLVRAQFLKVGLVAARARNAPLLSRRNGELQQRAERRGASVMHGGAHRHLDGLQIETARLAALLEDDPQELVYFADDFLTDRFRRFFSSGVRVSSRGRKRQTRSLTSTSSRLSC